MGESGWVVYFTFQPWMLPEEWTKPTPIQPQDLAAIRSRYLAKEMSLVSQWSLGFGRPLVRSSFDLHIREDQVT